MENKTREREQKQRCEIKINGNGYQLIFKDDYVSLKARFYWENNEIIKGDFKLTNHRRQNGNRFKLHKVFFCKEFQRLEAFISHHSLNETKKHKLYDEYIKGFYPKTAEENQLNDINFLLTISLEPITIINEIKECNRDKPKDKDGSIIVGI
ncbi:hypothetical protein GCM10022393_40710 [Aquimarina addita]|uniref:Uncharacterized protein n=1 Tax=Aquimarina addita TaxID=870485 RepID=A0ABP6UXM4_9FLAO